MIGRSRIKGSSSATGDQTWRASWAAAQRVNSTQAKKRRINNVLRITGVLVTIIGLSALVFLTVVSFVNENGDSDQYAISHDREFDL